MRSPQVGCSSEVMLDSFTDCGVLTELGDSVFFRYKRFQEFFVSGYLRDAPQELERIRNEQYLEFTREFDLYTARFRHENSFLEVGRRNLRETRIPKPMEGTQLTDYLASGIRTDFAINQLQTMRKEPMTADKIDALLDETERKVAKKRT